MTFHRYVALGDSFTEGVGDPDETRPNGLRGWADRVAEQLAKNNPDFGYANLAIRGKLLQQVIDEQVEEALALNPDLITISAGGNDTIRPGSNPDIIAAKLGEALERLRSGGATVVVFTGVDVGFSKVFSRIRGLVAIQNENIRLEAARTGAIVADLWALKSIQNPKMWDEDRLHLAPLGHQAVAAMVLKTLGVPHDLEDPEPPAVQPLPWRKEKMEDIAWAKDHLFPWVMRRIRHQSSGDNISPKLPTPVPPLPPSTDE